MQFETTSIVSVVFGLLFAHALADFSLQIDAMAKGKNRNVKPDYTRPGQKYTPCWFYWLTSHALIHGGLVAMVTLNVWLGIAETVLHWLIDFAKCKSKTNLHQDQLLHMLCKAVYILVLVKIP